MKLTLVFLAVCSYVATEMSQDKKDCLNDVYKEKLIGNGFVTELKNCTGDSDARTTEIEELTDEADDIWEQKCGKSTCENAEDLESMSSKLQEANKQMKELEGEFPDCSIIPEVVEDLDYMETECKDK